MADRHLNAAETANPHDMNRYLTTRFIAITVTLIIILGFFYGVAYFFGNNVEPDHNRKTEELVEKLMLSTDVKECQTGDKTAANVRFYRAKINNKYLLRIRHYTNWWGNPETEIYLSDPGGSYYPLNGKSWMNKVQPATLEKFLTHFETWIEHCATSKNTTHD